MSVELLKWKKIASLQREFKMYGNQKLSIFHFIKWLSEQYIQLEKKTIPYPFKLGLFTDNKYFSVKNGVLFVKVEFSGQKDTIEIELTQILVQNLFEYFSPEDKKKIFHAHYNKEQYRFTDNYYCQEKQTEIIVLTDLETGETKSIPSSSLSNNDYLIEKISHKDVRKITAIATIEHFKNIFMRTSNEH